MSIEPGIFRSMPGSDRGTDRGSGPARIEERLAVRGGWVELLRLPAFAYRCATSARNALYDRRLLRAHAVDVPVVSVGNVTAGGTGKTPFAVWLAQHLVAAGRRPAILSRGYGARAATRGGSDGAARSDEVELLARTLSHVPRLADRDRVRGARELERLGVDVVLLDDGFQHRRLARDLDIVLVDATRPFGFAPDAQGRCVRALLPRGLLREDPRGLARADVICLTRTDLVGPEALHALRDELDELAPGRPLVETRHRCVAVREHLGREAAVAATGAGRLAEALADGARWGAGWLLSPDALNGRTVDLVSGIGHPEAFAATVASIGARIRTHRVFPDHHAFTATDLDGLGEAGRELVTTAKDAVKLERFGRPFWTVEVAIEVGAGRPALEALLEALPEGRAARERRALHEGLHG